MTFDCWINLFLNVDTFSGSCIIVTLLLLISILVMAITLTYKLVMQSDNKNKNKKYLMSLMIAPYCIFVVLWLVLMQQVFWTHAEYPYASINYGNMCPNTNLMNAYFSINRWVVLTCSLAYVSLINVYFQRFLGIFKNSVFESTKIDNILVSIYFCINFVTAAFAFIWSVVTGPRSFVNPLALAVFQLTYLFETYHICHTLKSKLISFMKLIENIKFTANSVDGKTSAHNASKESKNNTQYIDSLSSRTVGIFHQTKRLTVLSYATFISTLLCMIGNVLLITILIVPRFKSMSILIISLLDGFIS